MAMNLRDLRYFVALADHLHFGRAAAACFVSQPTLSNQLRKLEEELGATLIERVPRRIMLTAAGVEIALRARAILHEVEQLQVVARRSIDPESGTVRLGVFPTLGPYLLPHVVPRLAARLPALELLLVEEKSDALLQQLRAGQLDAALLALPVADAQLHVEILFDEPFVLAVPSRQAKRLGTRVSLQDLRDESLLLLEEGHCLRAQALDVCDLAGAQARSGFRATSLETLRQMVAAGVGSTLLPLLSIAPPVAASEAIATFDFTGNAPGRRIGMLWRRSSAMSAVLHVIAKECATAAHAAMRTVPRAPGVHSAPRRTRKIPAPPPSGPTRKARR